MTTDNSDQSYIDRFRQFDVSAFATRQANGFRRLCPDWSPCVRFVLIGFPVMFVLALAGTVGKMSRDNTPQSQMSLAWFSAQLACLLVCATPPLCGTWLVLRCLTTEHVRFRTTLKRIGDMVGIGTALGFIVGVLVVAMSIVPLEPGMPPRQPLDLVVTIGVSSIGAALTSVPVALIRELGLATRQKDINRAVAAGSVATVALLVTSMTTGALHLTPSECLRYFFAPNVAPVVNHWISDKSQRPEATRQLMESLGGGSINATGFAWVMFSAVLISGLATALWDWWHRGDARPRTFGG